MKSLKRVEGINVVPLIDVMLVLLAVVLTVSTFMVTGQIRIDLPNATTNEITETKNIEILITNGGEIFFDTQKIERNELDAKISALSKRDAISIKSDKKSEFENFVFVIDTLKKHGIEKISIVTKTNE